MEVTLAETEQQILTRDRANLNRRAWIRFASAALSAGPDVAVKDAATKADKMLDEVLKRTFAPPEYDSNRLV